MRYISAILIFTLTHFGAYSQTKTVYDDPEFISTVLKQHNEFRLGVGVSPMKWSSSLAKDALDWAQQLAKLDQGQHDPRVRGLKEGENIWWGTASAYSYGEMVNFWGNEKKDFVYGVFPDCKTRRSAVVGHYTQVIWKGTSSVGCAVASNGKTDFLVCRYSPPGNIEGEKPY
ncbi:MAG TPA: CAP domain-containing protein [Puia sp.]|nr:CAP domain-containing protein [Puia sp.]